jgi:cysteine desulfurase
MLSAAVPGVIFHESADGLPGILNCAFPGISGEELLMRLDLQGICVSTGAACAAGDGAPSHVLLAMGCSEDEARRSVRFSMGRLTTAGELETAAAAVARIVREKKK